MNKILSAAFLAVFFFIFTSCSDFKDSTVGMEGKRCFSNNTCKSGLICVEGFCVKEDQGNTGDTGDTGNTGDTGDSGNTGDDGIDDDREDRDVEIPDDETDDELSDTDEIDPCNPNPCTSVDNADGMCMVEPFSEIGYTCACNEGFEWGGDEDPFCNAIPDPCPEVECHLNSSCVPDMTTGGQYTATYYCECNEGWAENESGNKCIMSWRSVSTGQDHSCAVSYAGDLYCWGSNYDGQLGSNENGSGFDRAVPLKISSGSDSVSAGEAHSCSIEVQDSRLHCWGNNYYGQVGNNTSGDTGSPVKIPTETGHLAPVSFISSGRAHNCLIDGGNKLYCWGWNIHGQIGNDSQTDQYVPLLIMSTMNWLAVSAGGFHTCAINSTNNLYCWGWNDKGQLGNSTNNNVLAPGQIGSDQWQSVSCGYEYTCGIRLNYDLYCWGENVAGQLGDDSYENRNVPFKVGTAQWKTVSAGKDHTCAITVNNDLYCWGNNFFGELGVGLDGGGFPSPQLLAGKWKYVSAGSSFTCAIAESDAMFCWGRNEFGKIGVGSTEEKYIDPQEIEEYLN